MPTWGANTTWFRFSVSGGPEFLVYAFSGVERISRPYSFNIELVSPFASEHLVDLLGREACLTIADRSGDARVVHGVIREMEQRHTANFRTHYQCVLVPRFWFLGLRRNHRIFQHASVVDIISRILLEQHFVSDSFAFKCFHTYPQREYCVQYGESDLHFISRLCEEEGIYYYFEHSENGHCLCFSDMPGGPRIGGECDLRYFPGSGQPADTAVVARAELHTQSVSDKATYRDWNFLTPSAVVEGLADEPDFFQAPTAAGMDVDTYTYPHICPSSNEAARYADIQLHRQLALQTWLEARSDVSRFAPGFTFALHGHDLEQINAGWWVTSVAHHGEQPQVLEHEAPDRGMTYAAQVTAIPEATRYVPEAAHPKNRVMGEQTAIVTGPAGEEIYTDDYGRVKVQFFWDREGAQDERTTCWIRPAQGWAGTEFGALAIPRVGHEVIVSFLEGDPDRPLITGRVYHADNMPPYELPAHKTRTVFKSLSTPGGEGARGFNEFRVEDKAGEEEIYVHGEKDVNIHVKNDGKKRILRDRHQTVDNNGYVETKGETHVSLQGPRKTELFADDHVTLHADSHVKVDGNWLGKAGDEIHVESGQRMVLEAGSELTVKAGGSWIKVDASGVHVQGGMIGIAGGGCPGAGSTPATLFPTATLVPPLMNESHHKDKQPQIIRSTAKTFPVSQEGSSAGEETQPVELEVEFLHCTDSVAVRDCAKRITAISSDKFIREEQADILLTQEEKQYVNLPVNDKWRNADITHVDRLGRQPRIVVRYKRRLERKVHVEITPLIDGDTLHYTDAEKSRNPKFTDKLSGEYTTNADGVAFIYDLTIHVMGGNKYKLKAVDNKTGEVVFSQGSIVVWKYLWLQKYICSAGFWSPTSDPFIGFNKMKEEYKKSFIDINLDLPVKPVKCDELVDFENEDSLKVIKKALYSDIQIKDKLPYLTSAAVCRAIGLSGRAFYINDVNVGPGCDPIIEYEPDSFIATYAVYDEKKGTYSPHKWLLSATFKDQDISHLVTCHTVGQNLGTSGTPHFLATHLEIDISKLPAGKGILSIEYKTVKGNIVGRNWEGVCHCAAEANDVVNPQVPGQETVAPLLKKVTDYIPFLPIVIGHEVGHWIGMVSNGQYSYPDKPPNYYDEKTSKLDKELLTHIGPHCKSGYNGFSGACLMFGAAGYLSYCPDCLIVTRKLDCDL